MSWVEGGVIFVAGVWAGTINTIVGSGTLVTFPVLLAVGLPPRIATISNAFGQIAGGLSGTWGYRSLLKGQRDRIRRQLPASLLGALTGAYLLLQLPSTSFESIVPVLLILAVVLVIVQPFLAQWIKNRTPVTNDASGRRPRVRTILVIVATYAIGVYGGYFAAAQGVMLIAVLSILIAEDLQRLNALKNLLSLTVNVVAAGCYAIVAFDKVNWVAAGLIACGTLIGGFIGARVGIRLKPGILRTFIVTLGIVAIWQIVH